MQRTIQISIALFVAALMISACTFTIGPAPTAAPTIIFVPVTVTPGETATPQPTDTPAPSPTTVPTDTAIPPTNTPELMRFHVSGLVWLDQCAYVEGPTPSPLPKGCVADPFSNGVTADGIFQAGESGIPGVTIRLAIDCNYGAFTTTTDSGGYYSMSFTVPRSAGISEQKICLSIDAASAENASLLTRGGWTAPRSKGSSVVVQITIPVETQNTVSFGWDPQLR